MNNIMNNPEISIIVPVYNVSQFLPFCLDSLRGQMAPRKMEVILVDDGSTDQSGQICDKYAKQYPDLFKVIHKTNGGLASARQAGLENATGEYIAVCDSDDWISASAYSQLLNFARSNDADVVICDYNCVYDNGDVSIVRMNLEHCLNRDALLKISLSSNKYNSLCNKFFKRSIFTDNNLNWTEGINLGEDALMWSRILCLPKLKVAYLPKAFYNYRRRFGEDTYTNKLTTEKWEQLKRVHEIRKKLINEKHLVDSACDVVFAGLRTEDLQNHILKQFISDNIKFVRLFSFKPKRLVCLSAKLCGLSFTKFIIKKLYRFVYK